jgi:DNA invertase Pin-like site-specific DNA recombinase
MTAPPAHTTLAYLRVSTLDQDIEKNKADILHFANQHDLGQVRFVEEVASGRTPWRERRIAEVLEALRADDALIVAELSRLGLATRKGIRVYSVKGNWHLDQSLQSKILALAFSMAAEIERDLISQRTREALRFKKAQGLKLGRPRGPGKSKLDAFRPEIESLLANGSTQKFSAQRYHTTEANLHNWLKKHGLKTARSSPLT